MVVDVGAEKKVRGAECVRLHRVVIDTKTHDRYASSLTFLHSVKAQTFSLYKLLSASAVFL